MTDLRDKPLAELFERLRIYLTRVPGDITESAAAYLNEIAERQHDAPCGCELACRVDYIDYPEEIAVCCIILRRACRGEK